MDKTIKEDGSNAAKLWTEYFTSLGKGTVSPSIKKQPKPAKK